jgi:hypothetical protein
MSVGFITGFHTGAATDAFANVQQGRQLRFSLWCRSCGSTRNAAGSQLREISCPNGDLPSD